MKKLLILLTIFLLFNHIDSIFLNTDKIFNLLYASSLNDEYEEFINFQTFHDRDERLISFIRRELARAIVLFQFELKSFPDIEITINIAPDRETFSNWINERNVRLPNALGFADLKNNHIFIQNPRYIRSNKRLIDLLLHEYIHLYVNYHFDDAPLWFHEGLAWHYSEKITLNQTFQFMTNNAFNTNYLLIRYAYSYPENMMNIEPFYFQSAMLIRKMTDENKNQLIRLFDLGAQNQSFTEAFMNSFFMSDIEFLRIFERELQTFFRLNIYKGVILLTWLCFPIFLIIARIKKNRKTKELLAQWEIEDALSLESSLSTETQSADNLNIRSVDFHQNNKEIINEEE
ncbi:MAG: hypothetical protein FWG98_11680 [Candidatus Cloacimonetes bacterium]|nr:hypothetical protein [Candidatus Cloacimonadota bacterium]